MNTIKYIGIDVHQATSVFAVRNGASAVDCWQRDRNSHSMI
jgi:hypothetical protein